MQSSQLHNINLEPLSSKASHPNFVPFLAKTFQLPEKLYDGPNIYIEKYDMIISCPANHTIEFYNATTLLPFEGKKAPELPSSIVRAAHLPGTEICLFACFNGNMFTYDFSTNLLKIVLNNSCLKISTMEFLNSGNYAFLASESMYVHMQLPSNLYLGKLFYGSRTTFPLKNKNPCSLHLLPKSKILLLGLFNGSVMSVKINQVDRCPEMLMLDATCPLSGFRNMTGKPVTTIKSAVISGKEYVITGGSDRAMRIWCFIKGKMRLLRVINTEDIVSNILYLKRHKMIAVTCRTNYVKFFRFPGGKLEAKVLLGNQQYEGMFFMEDKNMLGISCCFKNEIKFVQLCSGEFQ